MAGRGRTATSERAGKVRQDNKKKNSNFSVEDIEDFTPRKKVTGNQNPYHNVQSSSERTYLQHKTDERNWAGKRPGGSAGGKTTANSGGKSGMNAKKIIGAAFDKAVETTQRKAQEKKPSWYTNNGSKVQSTSVKKVEEKKEEKKPSWYTNNGSKVKSTSVKKKGSK